MARFNFNREVSGVLSENSVAGAFGSVEPNSQYADGDARMPVLAFSKPIRRSTPETIFTGQKSKILKGGKKSKKKSSKKDG